MILLLAVSFVASLTEVAPVTLSRGVRASPGYIFSILPHCLSVFRFMYINLILLGE